MTITTTEPRKRIVVIKNSGLRVRYAFGYISDAELEEVLDQLVKEFSYDKKAMTIYTLGDEDADEEGTVWFCPNCGEYNEYGYEPETHLLYATDEHGQITPAHYYKEIVIDCIDCERTTNIHTEQFEEDVQDLNKLLKETNSSKGDVLS